MNRQRGHGETVRMDDALFIGEPLAVGLPDISLSTVEDLWVESMPDQVSAGCCLTSAGCFTSLGAFGSCASSSTSASTASCSC